MEVALMVTMAGLQVFIVRFFFQGARKGMRILGNCAGKLGCADWLCRLRVRGSILAGDSDDAMWTTNTWRREEDSVLWIAWAALCRCRRVPSSYHGHGLGFGVKTRSISSYN
jgi:hypothetical protein